MTETIKVPVCYRDLFAFPTAPRYLSYHGGRSSGKSYAAALAILANISRRRYRVLCAREYQNSINDSVKKLFDDLIQRCQLPGFISTKEFIAHVNGSTIIFKGLHDHVEASLKSLEGIDVCWVEEAQTISADSLNILIPTIRTYNSHIIFTWNPLYETDPVRRFLDTVPDNQKIDVAVSWRDLDNIGLLNDTIKETIRAAEGTPDYRHIWEGEPLARESRAILPRAELNKTITDAQPESDAPAAFGLDVARYGNDRTALAIWKGQQLTRLFSWTHASTTDTADRVARLANQYQPTKINIDDTGVGGGVTDYLMEKLHVPNVRPINYAARATSTKYPNIASELWFQFAENLQETRISADIENLSALLDELSARGWTFNSKNQLTIDSKQAYKQAGHRSPDLADAVLLGHYQPAAVLDWRVNL